MNNQALKKANNKPFSNYSIRTILFENESTNRRIAIKSSEKQTELLRKKSLLPVQNNLNDQISFKLNELLY